MPSIIPTDFLLEMKRLLDACEFELFSKALNTIPPISFRPNSIKDCTICNPNLKKVAWSSLGVYLTERPSFTFDPMLHAGGYYVQEAASMFIEAAVKQCGHPHLVLDLCASPGGKSTLLRSILPEDSLLIANEPIKTRANILGENLIKWGHENIAITNNYALDFHSLNCQFDLVIVDAPCSGEGMFRKDNPASDLWSMKNVEQCAQRQKNILSDIWPVIKEDGFLIYSTCTYNSRENEEIVEFIIKELNAELVCIPIESEWNIKGNWYNKSNFPVYHFLPHLTQGEGFFLALLQKKQSTDSIKSRKSKKVIGIDKNWKNAIVNQEEMALLKFNQKAFAVSISHLNIFESILDNLNPISLGIPLYEEKGNKQIPLHGLALSRKLNPDYFSHTELSWEDAIKYLRGESFSINSLKGYNIITYHGMPIGFVNNLGNRANNLYPSQWRIHSSYLPSEPPSIVCRNH